MGSLLLKLRAQMNGKEIYMAKKGSPEDCHCKTPSKTDENITFDNKKIDEHAPWYHNKLPGDTSGNV